MRYHALMDDPHITVTVLVIPEVETGRGCDVLAESHQADPPGPSLTPSEYDAVWKLWKGASLGLFAIFVVAMVDAARALRRIAA